MTTHKSDGGQDAASVLAASREALIVERIDGPAAVSGRGSFEAAHSKLMDEFLRARLGEVRAAAPMPLADVALVAVGGYGRRELSLASDIDLLVVCRKKIPEQALELAQPLFLPLWDMGFSLGHGVRTIADCVSLSMSDSKVLASLLDMRFLAGSRDVFDLLAERMQKKVFAKRKQKFLKWLWESREERLARYGDSSALLEPQLKEGVGGLRDYHSVLWLAHFLAGAAGAGQDAASLLGAVLDDEERRMLRSGASFVLRARNQLHRMTKRKNDLLYLDLQLPIAERLGFEDRAGRLGVEEFLGGLHRSMADIKSLASGFWNAHFTRPAKKSLLKPAPMQIEPPVDGVAVQDGEIRFSPGVAAGLADDPMPVMRLFLASARSGLPVGWEARRAAVRACRNVGRTLRESGEAAEVFDEILTSGNAWQTLEQMLETGVLAAYFPEFGKVQDRVQFDAYHTFPVGPHTLQTLRHLENLSVGDEPVFGALWKTLDSADRRTLLLGGLFHDIAKGSGDHETLGAEVTAQVLGRWGVDDEVAEDVIFLVRRHLLLAVTATRRDLSDESVVVRCAQHAGTARRLDLLYLLAYADSRATGPKAWNEWSLRLLAELYAKARHMLEQGAPASGAVAMDAGRTMEQNLQEVQSLLRKKEHAALGEEWASGRLDAMPARYVQAVAPADVVNHLHLVRGFERELTEASQRLSPERAARGLVSLAPAPLGKGMWSLAVAAKWHKGLFATLTGVLALHDINIFSADVFVWADSTVLDVFTVSDPPDPLFADEYWSRVRGAVKYALAGKLQLQARLEEKRAAPSSARFLGARPVSVRVDNDSSDFYTVIEVRAPDRLGVLFDMAQVLSEMGLVIHVARIATDADQAMDAFYVRDELGGRLTDRQSAEELVRALTTRLS